MSTTVSIVATRTGTGPTSTIRIVSGDTSNAKAWYVSPKSVSEDDLQRSQRAIWQEIVQTASGRLTPKEIHHEKLKAQRTQSPRQGSAASGRMFIQRPRTK